MRALGGLAMLVRHLRVVRFLGFVALAVPVTVIACASETVEVRNEDPAPPASATGSSQPMPPTQPTTTTKPPDDGGTGAGKDSGPPPTDVADSAECQAYCAKMKPPAIERAIRRSTVRSRAASAQRRRATTSTARRRRGAGHAARAASRSSRAASATRRSVTDGERRAPACPPSLSWA